MGKEISLSIIVPTLNEEQFIERTLKALLNQSVPKEKYEVIVSDSSSVDNTVEIAKRYADKVVVCKRHTAGFGRNYGAKRAKSDFLGFVDADTIVSPTWVEGAIEALEKTMAATGPCRSIESRPLLHSLFYRWWSFQTWFSVAINFPVPPGYNIAVRHKEFERVGGFTERNIVADDIDFALRVKKLGRFSFNRKMLVYTSNRRLQDVGIIPYVFRGTQYVLTRKTVGWERHRKDFRK